MSEIARSWSGRSALASSNLLRLDTTHTVDLPAYVWNIRAAYRGGFHLWPEGEEDPTERRLKAEVTVPVSRRLKKG
jgi:hypothetical protein